ncbi:hypothetical protein GGR42_000354 [Saonia flava]|uniref:GmrSD restriction endonucleases N-terminal domain-containing protein n=1 Tax=Saonia flava TaxID=523696 RepID=A0A846QTQ5_9FLAO|nr:DUF262 domain-containing protein [Saonia flava]NJB69892.1 hypothetical protein [Saonia flava]
MKLKAPIPSNSVKLIDLYNKITSGSLILGPDFQRKLVWKKQHKYAFIETILLNFPFPEVYIASEEVDIDNLKAREVVVDGKQRLSSIVDYIQKDGDFSNQKSIPHFDDLEKAEKREFLNYLITVKDLKDIGEERIIQVFKRINSTNYSLNSNEILNAEYGGGEFAIFGKLLTDIDYNPSEKETSVLISADLRQSIINFFEENKVFSNNDVKRMFDSQYIMLIASTLLEGTYFGRSNRINYYLEKYNDDFSSYSDILGRITNSISIIKELKFSSGSYWFNKANLFTLIVELNNIEKSDLDLDLLEFMLLDLENKYDIYYNGDEEEELEKLTADETKYFEVARQGSHENAAREHRGNVIRGLINESRINEAVIAESDVYTKNIEILKAKGIDYSIIIPTDTGLKKSIMDAVSGVREFLLRNGIHDYENQELGPTHKVKPECIFITNDGEFSTEVSLYRSNGRGDYRIWFSGLGDFADSKDELALIYIDGTLKLLNISKIDYTAKV